LKTEQLCLCPKTEEAETDFGYV